MSIGSPQHPSLRIDVLVCFFAYGGNGGIAMQLPQIGNWWAATLGKLNADPRINRIHSITLSDTPITMTRNRAVRLARDGGFHLLVMVDSDNEPDLYVPHGAKPFWDTTFDFLYERYKAGLPTVVGAPYCGPPPHPTTGGEENVYVFRWTNYESGNEDATYKLDAYSRAEASQMEGIHPAGALPTGLLMATVSAFDLCCPDGKPVAHFYYEWKDEWQSEKASTEDVTATRDISLAGAALLGEDVVFCNWDCWAGHHKPKCVGKPKIPTADNVGRVLEKSIRHGIDPRLRWKFINAKFPHYKPKMAPYEAEAMLDSKSNGNHWHETTADSDETALPAQHPPEIRRVHSGATIEDVMVNGRKIWVGSTPAEFMESVRSTLFELRELSRKLAKSKRRPLRAMEIRSRGAEGAIAMANGFGKHGGCVYCIETENAEQAIFNADDLSGDQVKVLDCLLSELTEPQDADIVFVSGHPTDEILKNAAKHVAADGLLVGLAEFPPEGIEHTNGGRLWMAKGRAL